MKLLKPVNFVAAFLNLLILAVSITVLATHQALPSAVPLWFSRVWGETRLAKANDLWLIPVLITGFFLVSNILGKIISRNYLTLAKILVWSATFISLVFLLTLYKIILITI